MFDESIPRVVLAVVLGLVLDFRHVSEDEDENEHELAAMSFQTGS